MSNDAGIFDRENHGKLAIALLRMSAGIMFLRACWPKVTAGAAWAGRMAGFIGAQQNTSQWYKHFLDAVVIPNTHLFGFLTAYGELAVGLALVFGIFTRPALIGGLVLVINYWLAKGTGFWTPSSNDSFMILILAALFFLKPGQYLGLDAYIAKRFARPHQEAAV